MTVVNRQNPQYGSIEERKVLSKAFFNLVHHWQLSNQETASLLGWNYDNKRTTIEGMRRKHSPLPQDQDKVERVRDLINIHKNLRILFPNQRDRVYEWIKIPRERFGNHSALDIMLTDGQLGIAAIRRYLDYERTR